LVVPEPEVVAELAPPDAEPELHPAQLGLF
jgi:hypothetical protein